jgi:hypothetical protein
MTLAEGAVRAKEAQKPRVTIRVLTENILLKG